jgi:hypothetical protein
MVLVCLYSLCSLTYIAKLVPEPVASFEQSQPVASQNLSDTRAEACQFVGQAPQKSTKSQN